MTTDTFDTAYSLKKLLKSIPAGTTREKNEELYAEVRDGSWGAVSRMIEANMGLAVSKVETALAIYPHAERLREDLYSEAFLGLSIAVNKLAQTALEEHENLVGYMSYWITFQIGDFIDREFPQDVITEQGRRHRKKRPKTEAIDEVEEASMPASVVDPTAMLELRDLLDACCETQTDRDILRLRERGNTVLVSPNEACEHAAMSDAEIAEALSIPVTTCYMLRRQLYARFLEKSGMKGEV